MKSGFIHPDFYLGCQQGFQMLRIYWTVYNPNNNLVKGKPHA